MLLDCNCYSSVFPFKSRLLKFYTIYITLYLVGFMPFQSLNTTQHFKKNLVCLFWLVAMHTIKSHWSWEYQNIACIILLTDLFPKTLGLQNEYVKLTLLSSCINYPGAAIPSLPLPPFLFVFLAGLVLSSLSAGRLGCLRQRESRCRQRRSVAGTFLV